MQTDEKYRFGATSRKNRSCRIVLLYKLLQKKQILFIKLKKNKILKRALEIA